MREHKKIGGLPGANIEGAPPWLKNARAYRREPSVGEGFDNITGYTEFNGLKGNEAAALTQAVAEAAPEQRVYHHHQSVYTFVRLPKDAADKVEAKLQGWKYSRRNQVDLLKRSLQR